MSAWIKVSLSEATFPDFNDDLPTFFAQAGEKPIRITSEARAELSKAIGEKGVADIQDIFL